MLESRIGYRMGNRVLGSNVYVEFKCSRTQLTHTATRIKRCFLLRFQGHQIVVAAVEHTDRSRLFFSVICSSDYDWPLKSHGRWSQLPLLCEWSYSEHDKDVIVHNFIHPCKTCKKEQMASYILRREI